jgi:hypothetical protein
LVFVCPFWYVFFQLVCCTKKKLASLYGDDGKGEHEW